MKESPIFAKGESIEITRDAPACLHFIMMCLIILTVNLALTSSQVSFAESNRDQALRLWDQGKTLYKQKKYSKAAKAFYKSNRVIQESKCLYMYALSIQKQTQPPCQDKVSAWERYTDSCLQREGSCSSAWLDKARDKLKKIKTTCDRHTYVQPRSKVVNQRTQESSRPHAKGDRLKLMATFQCRFKKKRGGYEAVRSCNGETFQENDQVRFSITPMSDGYVYLLLFNESGQAQMLWPTPSDDNHVTQKTAYTFPTDPVYSGWWEVDHVKDVKEVISIIFSRERVDRLESLRGVEISSKLAQSYSFRDSSIARKLSEWKSATAQETNQAISEVFEGSTTRVIAQFYFYHE
jgi:hypothetical protein